MLKSLTQLKFIPLPITHSAAAESKKNIQIDVGQHVSLLNDPTNYGIFDYSQESQLKYTSVQKFYPKTYPMQNSPKIVQHHWTS